jgi:hypothetical protein
MDSNQFDRLTRLLSHHRSRRSALAGIVGGVAGAWHGTAIASQKRREAKRNTAKRRRPEQLTADAPACRTQGHPCEGNQHCCAPFVCVVSGPGNAQRCTPCPSGTIYFEGACCTPTTCAAQAKNCGQVDDTCGGTLTCGSCTPPQTCGGGQPGVPNICGCTPTCPPNACGPSPDGCGGIIDCQTCTPGDVCTGTPQATCQACSAATAQPDLCSEPQAICGNEDEGPPNPDCFCVRSTSGGSLCTRFARSLCNSAEHGLPPICATDADCQARGYSHCIPATQSGCENCSGGTACAFACFFCPDGQHACKDHVCCPNAQACCRGVCCEPGERCRGSGDNRQCVLV